MNPKFFTNKEKKFTYDNWINGTTFFLMPIVPKD